MTMAAYFSASSTMPASGASSPSMLKIVSVTINLRPPLGACFNCCSNWLEIAMPVDFRLGARQTATVDDAGVIERVAENHIAFADQRRKDARVRLKTGVENQRRFACL